MYKYIYNGYIPMNIYIYIWEDAYICIVLNRGYYIFNVLKWFYKLLLLL